MICPCSFFFQAVFQDFYTCECVEADLLEVMRTIKQEKLPILSGDVPASWTEIMLAGERGKV
jgi:hypothetical protein